MDNVNPPVGKRHPFRVIKKFCKEADMILLCLCLLASLISILAISSAVKSFSGSYRYLIIQSAAAGIGIFLFVLFSLLDLDDLSSYWKIILLFNILFILSTYFFGIEVNGNRSWIRIPGVGITIQPAEIVKVPFILLLSKQFYLNRDHVSSPLSVGTCGIHLAMMVGLIWFASDDMGMSVVYIFIFLCIAFAAGVKLWWFLGGIAGVAAASPYIWKTLGPYQKMRILVVIDDTLDPLGIGYQARMSKLTLGAGKLTGQGLFKGTQTQRGTLPEKESDFIYSVIGEEFGFIGCCFVLLLLVLIIFRCLYVAAHARNGFGSLVCVGVAGMFIFQTFENIGMCIGLTPVIGITLPFLSYGGSSTITMYAAIGLISSVRMRPMPEWLKSAQKAGS